DWPDGAEVEIRLARESGDNGDRSMNPDESARTPAAMDKTRRPEETAEEPVEEGWSNSPEAIADWLKWYDSLEPLTLTPEEEADAEAWMRKVNDYAIAKMNKVPE